MEKIIVVSLLLIIFGFFYNKYYNTSATGMTTSSMQQLGGDCSGYITTCSPGTTPFASNTCVTTEPINVITDPNVQTGGGNCLQKKTGPGCRTYGNYNNDDSSLLGSNDLEKNKCSIMADETKFKFYNNPCMTAIPYGTKTAGWEYMEKLPELNRELYKDCTKYGCKKPGDCPVLPGLAKLCGIDPEETRARNNITEEMYHNPQLFCEKNPKHPRCAKYSGLFTPFTYSTDALTPMNKCHPIGRPPQTGVDGYCLEVNPNCSLDDTKSITIIQPQMLDPRC